MTFLIVFLLFFIVIYGPERKLAKEFIEKEEIRLKKAKKPAFLRMDEAVAPKNLKKIPPSKILSKVEKDLFLEAKLIKERKKLKENAERQGLGTIVRDNFRYSDYL